MKKYLTPLVFMLAVLFFTAAAYSQNKGGFRKRTPFDKDSIALKIQKLKDSVDKTLREVKGENDIGKNVEALLQLSEKNKKKQKRDSFIRIGIAVALLTFLIAVLLRRRAKK